MGRGETCPWGEYRGQRTSCAKARKVLSSSIGIDNSTLKGTTREIVDTHLTPSTEDCGGLLSNTVTSMGGFTGSGADVIQEEEPSKGVRKRGTKWVAEIRNRHIRGGRHPGRKWLGTFSTAAEAREAYARAVKKINSTSQKAPGSSKARDLSLDASHTSVSSSLSSSTWSGAKTAREKLSKEPRQSKKARRNGSGTASDTPRRDKLVSSPLYSMHLEGIDGEKIKDGASFEREAVTMQSSTVSSSSDPPQRTSPIAPKFRNIRSKKFDGLGCRERTLGLCFTSFADSHYSSCNDQLPASGAPSPSSSCATSRLIDEDNTCKNQSFDDSLIKGPRRSKSLTDAGHANGLVKNAPAMSHVLSQVGDSTYCEFPLSNDAPRFSTSFSYPDTVDHDKINFSPAFLELGERCDPSAEKAQESPVCTEKQKGSQPSSCNGTCPLVQKNGVDYFVQNGVTVANQEQEIFQECEDLLQLFDDVELKTEDLAAFKTKHVQSELISEYDLEFGCSESPQTTDYELLDTSQLIWWNKGKDYLNTGSSHVFTSPASSAVCSGMPEQQFSFVDSLNRWEQSFKSELVEPGSLTLTDGISTFSKKTDSFNFLPVDDLLEYF